MSDDNVNVPAPESNPTPAAPADVPAAPAPAYAPAVSPAPAHRKGVLVPTWLFVVLLAVTAIFVLGAAARLVLGVAHRAMGFELRRTYPIGGRAFDHGTGRGFFPGN